ncbi:MAG: NAD(P)-dependent dehydrogenase (short-subunit alcohol dehydrogenase family) [Gammaproteobacteria bacterium]|jgi:NAD(P)-dependent dehydrogenase (short-subunit alcohol dehydrogenase family)
MKRVVIVTGAVRGIGRATAEAFLDQGDQVIGLDIDAEAINAAPFDGIVADMGDKGAIDAALAQVIEEHGRIDVLVNNAGITRRAGLLELTESDWDNITRVNAKGAFFAMQGAARQMIEQGNGRIINMASIAGKGFHNSSNVIYAGTKGALIAMTRMAAYHLGPHGISVNAVCPGTTETDIISGLIERDAEEQGISVEESRSNMFSIIPNGQANTPEEVAALVVFLASPAARNITGQAINIDGGLLMA